MCNSIARCLGPAGRFVTVNCNPALDFLNAPSYRKYGFESNVANDLREGSPITWTFFLEDGSFEIENHFLDVAIYEEAFHQLDFAKSVGISLFYLQMAKRPTVEISGKAFWSTLPQRSLSALSNKHTQ